MTTTDTFSSALASWHEAIDAGPQPDLARTLLGAAESRLAADLQRVSTTQGDSGPTGPADVADATDPSAPTGAGRVEVDPVTRRLWHSFLEETSVPSFLSALGGPDERRRWAEITLTNSARDFLSLSRFLSRSLKTARSRNSPDQAGSGSRFAGSTSTTRGLIASRYAEVWASQE